MVGSTKHSRRNDVLCVVCSAWNPDTSAFCSRCRVPLDTSGSVDIERLRTVVEELSEQQRKDRTRSRLIRVGLVLAVVLAIVGWRTFDYLGTVRFMGPPALAISAAVLVVFNPAISPALAKEEPPVGGQPKPFKVPEVDMVFTSPPYFNREAYGEDEKQSYKKFPGYDQWKEGYLQPTLQTAVEYLRPGCYLIWNIADLLQGKEYLPLEEDSRQILRDLGMVTGSEAPGQYKQPDVLKMAMQSMPGQHRLNEDGTPKAKNFCKVNGQYLKYEPVFVYWKPLDP